MLNKAVTVSNYNFKPEDKLLLDANIWLFLYGPNKPKDRGQKAYSQAFRNMINANSQIYIDVLIVSEFINRYARIKWELKKDESQVSKNFKKFRQSKDFEPVAKEVANATGQVLKHCKRIKNGFETLEIDTLIDEYGEGKSDFNDQVIAVICKRERLKLVTDDSDFGVRGIPVLTANKKLLN